MDNNRPLSPIKVQHDNPRDPLFFPFLNQWGDNFIPCNEKQKTGNVDSRMYQKSE